MAWMDEYISANDFDSIRLTVASSDDVLNWSYGEVLKPETINYRTQKPERDGLFCERIFGPVKDINPHDTKFRGVRSREAAVDKEGNLVTKSISRRERMGHIALAAPVAHVWFMHNSPYTMSLLLGIATKSIERVAYFASYIILSVKEEKLAQVMADLEAEHEAASAAINIRYEKDAEGKDANVKALAEARTKELEELEEDYVAKKAQLNALNKSALISETDYRNLPEEYEDLITVGMGASAIKTLLEEINLDKLIDELREEAEGAKGQKEKKLVKRLKVLEGMEAAGIKPVDLVMTVVPVIPPDLRPMVSLAGGRFATSDLNDLYRRVINRNNRLKKLIDLNAPEVIQRNEMRMLQEAVDSLIDNSSSRGSRGASANNRRRLKSLSDMLKGKQGRFRQNLLGKRVDYSGRSVIVVGPELKIHQCGLPKQMALELFKPFVISWLIRGEHANNIKSAQRMIEAGETVVWDGLDDVIKDKYVLLNRAPSLHRLSIQAFQPKLIDGKAIQLHPLVAKGFNADYDGDQMAVHLPLSAAAQAEAKDLMSASRNLLKPADGSPVLNISQDVVLGCYYLTYDKLSAHKPTVQVYSSVYEAGMAYDNGDIALQTPIKVTVKGEMRETTLGKVFFNEVLPEDFPYQNDEIGSKKLKVVLGKIFDAYGAEATVKVADDIKDLAFQYATIGSVSTGKDDYAPYAEISNFIAEGDAKTALIYEQYNQGLLTNEERYNLTVGTWRQIDKNVEEFLKGKISELDTSVSTMTNSGARGSVMNVKLASAMIGTLSDIFGREIELPIRNSYSHGITALESFVASRGSRQGLISTALRTAESGYLTRRLVDVAQDVFTTDDENVEDPGFAIYRKESDETMISFANRLNGRYSAEDVAGHIEKDVLITKEIARQIEEDEEIESVKVQSVLTTAKLDGIPRKSYGIDMATGQLVAAFEPVGVIAAQSVGEPGTQLTLNTKHSSGVAGSGGISQGLPRVEELLEARAPKGQAYVASISGLVEVWEDGNKYVLQITPESGVTERFKLDGRKVKVKDDTEVKAGDVLAEGKGAKDLIIAPFDGVVEVEPEELVVVAAAGAPVRYEVPGTVELVVKSKDIVEAGDRLTAGSLDLHDLMKYKGIEATERYIINEVLKIYAAQGQDLADKHLEIIVRQMFSRVMIESPGDSTFVTGEIVSKAAAVETNNTLLAEGKKPIEYTQLLLGITKVSIWSDSFLSAASFQDTTRVLISSAISGRVDGLRGLKENVIIGRKIPVGTGAGKSLEAEMEFLTGDNTSSEPLAEELEAIK